MKACPHCGYSHIDHDDFCFSCGGELDPEPEEPYLGEVLPYLDYGGCARCGKTPDQDSGVWPMCRDCRIKLARRPFPLWIHLFGFAIVAVLILASARLPGAISAGMAYERGLRAAQAGNYAVARLEFDSAAEHYPESTPILCRLLIAQCKTMDVESAAITHNKIRGRHVSDSILREVNSAIQEMDSRFEAVEPEGGVR